MRGKNRWERNAKADELDEGFLGGELHDTANGVGVLRQ